MLVCPTLLVPASATSYDHVTATQFDIFVESLGNLLDYILGAIGDIYDNMDYWGGVLESSLTDIYNKLADIRSYLDSYIRAWIVVIADFSKSIVDKLDNVRERINVTNMNLDLVNGWLGQISTYLHQTLKPLIVSIKDTLTNIFVGESGAADDFNGQVSTDSTEFDENMDIIQDVTRPTIEDIDLDVDKEIPDGEVVKVGQLLGIFFQNQYIYIVFFVAFTFSLVSYGIFGKR